MRVLVAPDCFTGTLTATQAAHAMADGWRDHRPGDEVDLAPLSDGGPGFVDVLGAWGGELVPVTVTGPLGEPTVATLLLTRPPGGPVTAVVEAAQACGLHLVPPDRRDPTVTSTAGVGDLLRAALGAGATRVVVGVGGTGTNDAGAGMLARLIAPGSGGPDPYWGGGGGRLLGVGRDDLAALAGLAAGWARVELVLAADVDVPLLGFHGASAAFSAQKGATAAQSQHLERCLGDFAAAAEAVGPGLDRLALDRSPKLSARPHAGAGGGLGYGLLLLGAQPVAGAQWAVDAVGLRERAAAADLVLTGEGCFDWQSLRGKVVAGVARACAEVTAPVVVVAGQVDVGRREAQAIGVDATYAVAQTPAQVAASVADPVAALRTACARVARTWGR